jgi:hypothetical protein
MSSIAAIRANFAINSQSVITEAPRLRAAAAIAES